MGTVVAVVIGLLVIGVAAWLLLRRRPVAQTPAEAEPIIEPPESTQHRGYSRPREIDREARRELLLLDEALHRRFFERAALPPDEWARIADGLVFIHDRLPTGLVLERFQAATGSVVSGPGESHHTARELFALLNERLAPERRMVLRLTLDEPVEADVWTQPAEDAG
ncbi:MAG: hypothetical protein GX131_16875 [candidate division WS1 bacterium]|jgi:hypothetical protein|nr:hypothetical protein [candidate division WS1 bacterium]